MIRVLIVEDVKEMRELLRGFVAAISGIQVSGVAANGWEARLEMERRRPDLVLLDEILPGESSVDLLAEFRAQGIPVLLLTGMVAPTHPLPAGAAGRLGKPGWRYTDVELQRFGQTIIRAAAKSSGG